MRKTIALVLGALLPVLGFSGIGQAQSSIQVEGTIQAIDCQAQTIVLSTPGASNTVVAAPYTAVLVGSTSIPFCSLQQYLGARASAWLVASGNEFVATRIDVSAYASVPAPYAPPPPQVVVEPQPIAGIVLGTIFVAGLLFLLVRDHDGHFSRYPYYGQYYRHYYRPEYRPYRGPYHDAPVRWGNGGRDGRGAGDDRGGRDLVRPQDHWAGSGVPVRQDVPPRWTPPVQRDALPRWTPPVQRDAPPRWTPPVQRDALPRWTPPVQRDAPPRWTPPVQRDAPPRWTPPAQRDAPPRWAPPDGQNGPARRGANWDPRDRQDPRRGKGPDNRDRCQGSGNHQCGN